jgi:hypothetical protein
MLHTDTTPVHVGQTGLGSRDSLPALGTAFTLANPLHQVELSTLDTFQRAVPCDWLFLAQCSPANAGVSPGCIGAYFLLLLLTPLE